MFGFGLFFGCCCSQVGNEMKMNCGEVFFFFLVGVEKEKKKKKKTKNCLKKRFAQTN